MKARGPDIDDQITLIGVQTANLTAADFLFGTFV